ncbi:hypothetical protein ACFL6C_09495 [Myxococcota bacterium]
MRLVRLLTIWAAGSACMPPMWNQQRMGPRLTAKPADCPIEFASLSPQQMNAGFEMLGSVTTTGSLDFTPELKRKLQPLACEWGGDTVSIMSSAEVGVTKAVSFVVLQKRPAQSSEVPGPARASIGPLHVAAKMLVLELKSVRGVDPDVARLFTGLLTAQLDAVDGLKTIAPADVEAMLDVEKQKDMLGCDSAKCMAEIGGALGAELVLYGDVGQLGSQYNTNISVVDTRDSEVRARVSSLVDANEDALAQNVRVLVNEVVNKLNAPKE